MLNRKREGRMYSNANRAPHFLVTRMTLHPHPPYTPGGYKFPKKSCKLFVSVLKSTPVENFSAQNIPHGEIWPPKITGKIRFFAEKELFLI